MKLFLVLLSLAAAGCAANSNEVSLEKMSAKQRLYLGRINVKMNGETPPKCEIYLNYDIAPSINLTPDGLVVYKTDREKIQFRGIACLHNASRSRVAWHHKDLDLNKVKRTGDRDEILYFGDIDVDWTIDPKESLEAADNDHESMGSVKTGHVKDSGEMKVTVKDNAAETEAVFLAKTPQAKDKFKMKTALVTVKVDDKDEKEEK